MQFKTFMDKLSESHVEFRLDHRDKVKGDHKPTFKDHEATVSDTTDKATYVKVPAHKANSFKSAMKTKHGVTAELYEQTQNISEGAYEKSEENKRSADAAKKQGDMFSHHLHMADHHDNLAQWHGEKGRHGEADRHAEKAEQHHEKAMSLKEGVGLDESMTDSWKKVQSMDKGSVLDGKEGAKKRLAYLNAVHAHHKKYGNDTKKVKGEIESLNRSRLAEQETVEEGYYGGKQRSAAWHADGGANDEGWDDHKPSKQADHPHAVHINGKKWKTFGSQSHATNVAKKIKGATVHKEEVELDEAAEMQARSDYKLDKTGRKSHKEIVFHDGTQNKELDDKLKREETEMQEEMTDAQKQERERLVKGMKKNIAGFKAKYGDQAKSVMYATATKNAMKEETEEQRKDREEQLKKFSGQVEGNTHCAEEVEVIDEKSEQARKNKTMKNMMDASRGARWKVQNKVSGDDVRDWDGKHKTAQAQNKAIGRALRNEAKDEKEYGYEGDMALNQLATLTRCAEMIKDMLKPDTDMPEWVQSKITLATDYIQTAADYMYSEMNEELKGKQHKLDKNKNGKVDAHDFKLLRKEDAELEEQAPVAPSLMKHRISVTVSDPDHTMVSKRKEKIQKTVIVTHSDNKEGAQKVGEKFYKKKGYVVHDSHHAGMVKEEVELEENHLMDYRRYTQAAKNAHAKGDHDIAKDAESKAKKASDNYTRVTGKKPTFNEDFDQEGNLMAEKLKFADFIEKMNEQLLEYESDDSGVYRHTKKATYGTSYQGDDDEDEKPKKAAAPAEKRGRGRPAGSTGASYKPRSAATAAAAKAKAAATKAANKNK